MRLALFALSVLLTTATALASQPPSNVMAPVNTLLAVTEGQSAVDLDSLFTPDAIIIDEGAPYMYRGPHAGSTWLAHVNSIMTQRQMRDFTAVAGPAIEYSQTDDRAYLILPMSLSATGPKPFHETGTLTFTFLRTNGAWKFTSEVWTTTTRF